MTARAEEWSKSLLPGEEVVWQGRPRPGYRFRAVDVPMVVFGLFFTGISLLFVVTLWPYGLLIPHLWIGLYFTAGRFYVDRRIREHTSYAMTGSRALIVRTWPTRRSTSVNLRAVGDITLQEHRDGTGTISFGAPLGYPLAQMQWGRHAAPAFEFIPDPGRVMALAHRPPPDDARP